MYLQLKCLNLNQSVKTPLIIFFNKKFFWQNEHMSLPLNGAKVD